MQKKVYFLLLFILFLFTFSIEIKAQTTPNKFWSHVRFGGGVGISFSDGFFSGTLAPSAIYEFNESLALGVGLNGSYNSLKDRYKGTILGGSIIGLYTIIPEIQLSAEFEELHVSRNFEDYLGIEDDDYWYPALFIGAGFRSYFVTIGIRYDVLYDDEKSIYAASWMPFVRIYF